MTPVKRVAPPAPEILLEGAPTSVSDLEERLSRPTQLVLDTLHHLPGDVVVLGAGGKMGPSLARMLRRAFDQLGRRDRVIAVSRFGAADVADELRSAGVEVVPCDLLDRDAVRALPDAPLVVFMAGQKFGTTDAPWRTWAMNAVMPAIVGERYAAARLVAFSTGNVYPLVAAPGRGSRESDPLGPVGEYAASCVGRERVLEFAASTHRLHAAIVRLNYAHDLRYGVLTDIAQRVHAGLPVDLRMGYANAIWQGDANAQAIASLSHAASPPFVVNVTSPETISVRGVATYFGSVFHREVAFDGSESADALLSDAGRAAELFGPPSVPLAQLVAWVADWTLRGAPTLSRPTHFETRDGSF